MPGYSGTPLARKLGLKPGMWLVAPGAPAGDPAWLAPLPEGLRIVPRAGAPRRGRRGPVA